MTDPVSWGTFDDLFVEGLVQWIGGRRVLEVFAGNGLLASKLAARGVDIVATSLFSGHDGHTRGLHHPVTEMEASKAVKAFGPERDILLMAWPTADEGATRAALSWGTEKPIVFIGEVTRPELGFGGLGGCASDLFFELTAEAEEFACYTPRNQLERAAVRQLDRGAVEAWLRKRDERPAASPW